MTPSPYIRPALQATRTGIPDVTALLEGGLDRLEQALLVPAEEMTADDLYDLLAAWGSLQRVRAERLRPLDSAHLVAQAEDRLRCCAGDWGLRVLAVAQPQEWIAAGERLLRQDLDQLDPTTQVARIIALLVDLDDAELVAWGIKQWWQAQSEALTAGLRRCEEWLADHPHLFVAASVYIQTVGLSLEPDLPARALDLAWTADKFVLLLDELEDTEAYLMFVDLPALPIDLLTQAHQQPRFLPTPSPAWLPPLRTLPLAAAATEQPQPQLRLLRWRAPNPHRSALLVLPEGSDGDATVQVVFLERDERARTLAGVVVQLAGVGAVIADDGTATFTLRALHQAGRPPELAVGNPPEHWTLDD